MTSTMTPPPSVVHPSVAGGGGPGSGMRRKREDDESQASSATGATGVDSMRPVVQPRKRRKTFLRAFESINLLRESEDDGDDADSSQAVADDDVGAEGGYSSTTSSLEDEEGEEADQLLSDKEEAQRKVNRKVMLELVFGSDSKSVVDLKLQAMIRTTIRQTTQAVDEGAARDDMNIEPSYSRPSEPIQPHRFLHRSNSLPDVFACDHSSEHQMDAESTNNDSSQGEDP